MILVPLMICLGSFVPLIVAKHYKERRAKVKHWQRAKAVVYNISRQVLDSTHSRRSAFIKYRFSYNGTEYSGEISYGITPRKYQIGDAIEILFNPSNPNESDAPEYMVIGPFTLSSFDLIIYVFTTMSILFFAMGIVFFLFAHRIFK